MTVVMRGASEADECKDASNASAGGAEQRVVLKVHNGVESLPVVEAQNALLVHLSKAGFNVPCPLRAADGSLMAFETLALAPGPTTGTGGDAAADGTVAAESKGAEEASPPMRKHAVRMLRFVEGTVMSEVTPDLGLIRKVLGTAPLCRCGVASAALRPAQLCGALSC